MSRAERTVLVIAAVVVAVVAVSVSVTIALGSPEPARFEPGTPEAAVQAYLDAAWAGDRAALEALLSARVRAELDDEPLAPVPFCMRPEDRLVSVAESRIDGANATVTLRIEQFGGSGFGFERSSWEQPVALVFEDGGWKIDDRYLCV